MSFRQAHEKQVLIKSLQSYAPFGSVSPRILKKKAKLQPTFQVGPGAYQISLPIIKPIIQTIKKKNNNIIVKLSHIGTSSFQGDQQRFSQNQNQGVGPGKYMTEKIYSGHDGKIRQRKRAGNQILRLFKNRERKTATISQVRKIELDQYVEMPNIDDQANNKLNYPLNLPNKLKGSAWSKNKQQRIKYAKNPYQNIGPGQYYHQNQIKSRSKSQKHPSSSFRSQSIRSFFDNICFETNQDKKALMRQLIKYKSSSIGPGSYEIQQAKQQHNKFQFFGSTEERKI